MDLLRKAFTGSALGSYDKIFSIGELRGQERPLTSVGEEHAQEI